MEHPDFGEGEPRRRLATIFAADVAGYSRLMAEELLREEVAKWAEIVRVSGAKAE